MQDIIEQFDQIDIQHSVQIELFVTEIISPNLLGCVNL